MSYTLYKTANFGPSRGGLSTVGYTLTGGVRATAGVAEVGTGTGTYGATITFADGFAGSVLWDTGQGGSTVYASDDVNTAPVNTVQFGGHAVVLDANNLPGVNVVDVAGGAASVSSGAVAADVQTIQGHAATASGPVAFPASIGTSTYAGGPVTLADGSVTSSKFSVATPAAGLPTGFLEKMDRVFRRFFKRTVKDPNTDTIKTYADDGTTVLTTQAYTDDGQGSESVGAAT